MDFIKELRDSFPEGETSVDDAKKNLQIFFDKKAEDIDKVFGSYFDRLAGKTTNTISSGYSKASGVKEPKAKIIFSDIPHTTTVRQQDLQGKNIRINRPFSMTGVDNYGQVAFRITVNFGLFKNEFCTITDHPVPYGSKPPRNQYTKIRRETCDRLDALFKKPRPSSAA